MAAKKKPTKKKPAAKKSVKKATTAKKKPAARKKAPTKKKATKRGSSAPKKPTVLKSEILETIDSFTDVETPQMETTPETPQATEKVFTFTHVGEFFLAIVMLSLVFLTALYWIISVSQPALFSQIDSRGGICSIQETLALKQ
ncbi:MAG: hypothetical protein ABIG66_02470 [Candidatus Kerfeldbacteria bacterium]